MSKTLRIISVITAICIVAMVVLPVFSGSKIDETMQQMLNGQSIIEICKKNVDSTQGTQEESPLVKQAQLFALFLNPPPPPPQQVENRTSSNNQPVPPRPVQVAPKFELVATSFFAAKPELSLALIDEPGKGFSWVRPSSEIGHLVIEEIKDGTVVIRDGNRTYDLSAQRPPRVSLIKGENNNLQVPITSPGISMAPSAPTAVDRPGSVRRLAPSRATTQANTNTNIAPITKPAAVKEIPKETQQPEISPEEVAKWERFMENNQNLSEEEWLKKAEEMLEANSSQERISPDEANHLDQLGQGLNENYED